MLTTDATDGTLRPRSLQGVPPMYGKVFASLWDGSLGNSWASWSTFVFIIANCGPDGVLEMTPEAISRRSCIPLAEVEAALDLLSRPDPRSRSQAEGGRRIVPLDERGWGWQIVNYQHYRGLRDEQERRQQNRDAQQRHRSQPPSATVSRSQPPSAQGEVEVEVDKVLEHLSAGADERVPRNGSAKATPTYPAGFERFWLAYSSPRRGKKPTAFGQWRRHGCEMAVEAVMEGLERFKAGADWAGGYEPEPVKWLRHRCWEDDPVPKEAADRGDSEQAHWDARNAAFSRESAKLMQQLSDEPRRR